MSTIRTPGPHPERSGGTDDELARPPWELQPWEWVDETPSPETIYKLLDGLPDQWGVRLVDFITYVQPIPQSQKTKDANGRETGYRTVTKLYTSVAGRLKMLEKAQQVNGWKRTSLKPEKRTERGSAGILSLDGKVAYRVVLKVWNDQGELILERTGMASRSGLNAFERAETAATGRALGAAGIGIMPGSGVASLDEMQSAEHDRDRPGAGDVVEANGNDRESTMAAIAQLNEATRLLLDQPEEWATNRERAYLTDPQRARMKDEDIWDPVEGRVMWEKVPTQVLTNMRAAFDKRLKNEKAQRL